LLIQSHCWLLTVFILDPEQANNTTIGDNIPVEELDDDE
jgi:hypothetical protein